MKVINSKLTIEASESEIKFKISDEKFQRLTIGEFHGKAYLYMYGINPKIFKVLDNPPKLRNDKNILILDIGDKFFNVNIICQTVEEMKDRVEELKNVIGSLYAKFTEISKSKANRPKYHKKSFHKSNEDVSPEFGSIFIPDALEDLRVDLHKEEDSKKYPKSLNEYIKDLLEIYDAKDVAFLNKQGKLKLNFAFMDAVEGIRHTQLCD